MSFPMAIFFTQTLSSVSVQKQYESEQRGLSGVSRVSGVTVPVWHKLYPLPPSWHRGPSSFTVYRAPSLCKQCSNWAVRTCYLALKRDKCLSFFNVITFQILIIYSEARFKALPCWENWSAWKQSAFIKHSKTQASVCSHYWNDCFITIYNSTAILHSQAQFWCILFFFMYIKYNN